jgi:hypothetical protein
MLAADNFVRKTPLFWRGFLAEIRTELFAQAGAGGTRHAQETFERHEGVFFVAGASRGDYR